MPKDYMALYSLKPHSASLSLSLFLTLSLSVFQNPFSRAVNLNLTGIIN